MARNDSKLRGCTIIERIQHSRGSGANMFGGPDRYVSLISFPISEYQKDKMGFYPCSKYTLAKYDARIEGTWKGYSGHSGPRSKLGMARKAAVELAQELGLIDVDKLIEVLT